MLERELNELNDLDASLTDGVDRDSIAIRKLVLILKMVVLQLQMERSYRNEQEEYR